jgi:predicted Zn finger-like uncharacterized protein
MNITCTTCGSVYEMDDSQIPPGGLTMKCSKCQSTINLSPSAGAQDIRYYIRRSSGNVFGPFLEKAIISMLEQQKLEGSEEVSTDGNDWIPLSQVPVLTAATGSEAGVSAGVPLVTPPPTGPADISDLPAPKAGARPRPPSPAGPPAGGPPPIDLSAFDQGPATEPMDLADLPAPKAGSRPIIPSAPPPGRRSFPRRHRRGASPASPRTSPICQRLRRVADRSFPRRHRRGASPASPRTSPICLRLKRVADRSFPRRHRRGASPASPRTSPICQRLRLASAIYLRPRGASATYPRPRLASATCPCPRLASATCPRPREGSPIWPAASTT